MTRYFNSKKFDNTKITFGFFTRKKGFSSKNFSSLNCSYSSGDKYTFVKKNIEKAKNEIGLENNKLKLINQIHSKKVIKVTNKNFKEKHIGDGIITQDKNISIAILTADCCPIFLFDDNASFISCLHAGWKGCYLNIIDNALKKIIKIQPNLIKINAIIGPCLNKKNFEVSNVLKKKFIQKNSKYKNFFSTKYKKIFFDMRGLIKTQLISNKITNIEDVNIDTYSKKELFFSHRRSIHNNKSPTGRMINIIGFKKNY